MKDGSENKDSRREKSQKTQRGVKVRYRVHSIVRLSSITPRWSVCPSGLDQKGRRPTSVPQAERGLGIIPSIMPPLFVRDRVLSAQSTNTTQGPGNRLCQNSRLLCSLFTISRKGPTYGVPPTAMYDFLSDASNRAIESSSDLQVAGRSSKSRRTSSAREKGVEKPACRDKRGATEIDLAEVIRPRCSAQLSCVGATFPALEQQIPRFLLPRNAVPVGGWLQLLPATPSPQFRTTSGHPPLSGR